MPDDQTIMDVPELRDKLLDIVRRFPENVNPQAPATADSSPHCIYDDGEGNHCLIGQLAFEQGWRVPGYYETMSADTVAVQYSWPVNKNGKDYLRRIQGIADHGLDDMPDEPIRWSDERLIETITKAAEYYQ